MGLYQSIDTNIQKGYELLLEGEQLKGCDHWLEAWEAIKTLFDETGLKDIHELDKKYNWTQYVSNYAQDLEMELHNAGITDKSYHQKRIYYCQELLQFCGDDQLINSNTRRALAEAYFESGDVPECERLYSKWLNDDPNWGWGYIGWSDCYRYKSSAKQYDKAEEILLTGYSVSELRDKIEVVERIVSLYKDMGEPAKAKEYRKIFLTLQHEAPKSNPYYKPAPIVGSKIGRNEPCPCGSGKKHKKCCGG